MQLPKRWAAILLVMISLSFVQCTDEQSTGGAGSAAEKLQAFYGTFKGSGQTMGKDEVADRDLTVIITPWEKKGFTVDWSTTIYRDGREKKTHMSINFYPSPREGIYSSAMTGDVFGNTVPYNPTDRDESPYVWAGLMGDTLTVTALYIIDASGHELQVYKRTLKDNGLALEFERRKNGEKIAEITAFLKPVAP